MDEKDASPAQNASQRLESLHSELRYKRLETGTFQFPFAETGRKEIAAWELAVLLEGIDLRQGRRRKRYSRPAAAPEEGGKEGAEQGAP
jgi:hypothetical protein